MVAAQESVARGRVVAVSPTTTSPELGSFKSSASDVDPACDIAGIQGWLEDLRPARRR